MLERKQVTALHAAEREARMAHGRQAYPPHYIGLRPADKAGGHAKTGKPTVQVVRHGAIDLVLDGRIDHQPQILPVSHQPIAHVVSQRFWREVAEQLLAAEMTLGLGEARPFRPAL